jgi:two-component system response regulator GlrR
MNQQGRSVETAPLASRIQSTILCIEDEEAALQMRTAILESAGYRVYSARTANAAIALFIEHKIDLVLSDDFLLGVSGADLTIFMKQVRPNLAVMLVSGSPPLPRAIQMQMDGIIQKSGSAEELLDRIQMVLDNRSSKIT